MSEETIRVLVVEDHHVVRQGLVALLKVAGGIEVVGEAADGVEAIAQFRKHQPAITLIDLRLPRLCGRGGDRADSHGDAAGAVYRADHLRRRRGHLSRVAGGGAGLPAEGHDHAKS